MIKNLSVFFPAYNEEGSIESTVSGATKVLEKLGFQYEIIIVDDGSKDKTPRIADSLARKNPKIRIIHHPKNLGYGEALKSGFYNAKYDTICYTDGDGQFDFSEVSKFLERIEDHDLVIGYRIKRQDPFFRILFKKGWKVSLRTFFGLTLKDVDCGFKMIKRKVLEKIPHLESTRGAMINAELAIKAKKYGFKVGQVGVNHYPRLSGKPTGASITVIVRSYLDLLRLWWQLKEQKAFFILLVSILLLASFLRFYRISEYMTFLGDEGRDAIIIKDILTGKNFPLIGPPTSVGNIYLGPLYYYMMAVSMLPFWLNPVAAAGMNVLVGVAIVALIYYLGKIWFGRMAGLIGSYLYAISPVTIVYSRSSWNPNPTPFFALLAFFTFYRARKERNFKWLILTGALVGAAMQMHYLAVLLIPIFVTLWMIEVYSRRGIKNLMSGTLLGILSFIAVLAPLILFDLKHNFLNYRALLQLLSQGDAVGINIFENILKIGNIFTNSLIGRYITGENVYLTVLVYILILLALIKRTWISLALGLYLLIGLLGLAFYKGSIYDHYLGFLNPVPFLLLGSLVYTFHVSSKIRWIIWMGIFLLIIGLTAVNLQKSPLKNPPNNQLKRTQDVAKFIIKETEDKPFNFALLAQRNYDAAYQFYLDQYGHKPKQVPFDITDQLFVVCEDPICNPVGHPKQEISHFGWVKIARTWEVYGVKIYKLVHNL